MEYDYDTLRKRNGREPSWPKRLILKSLIEHPEGLTLEGMHKCFAATPEELKRHVRQLVKSGDIRKEPDGRFIYTP